MGNFIHFINANKPPIEPEIKNTTYQQVIDYMNKHSKKSDTLYELKDSHRLSRISQKVDGHLFHGNIYRAILEIDKFLRPHFHIIFDKYNEILEYKDIECQTPAVIVHYMVESWLNDDEFWIAEHKPIIH